jgi:hypothetical protein
MGKLLVGIILVIPTWIALGLIFAGVGLVARRVYGLKLQGAESLLTSFWLGWAFALLFLQLWHLYLPVDGRALSVVTALGLAGLFWNRQDLWALLTKRVSGKYLFFFFLLLTALWIADHAILLPMFYDSGLYHLHAVRWPNAYPIVPGLGNLHHRLAFNSSYFLYVALLEVGPWAQRSQHLANGLLLWALVAQMLLCGFKLIWRSNPKLEVYYLFNVMLLPATLKMGAHFFVASPSPDLPIFVLGMVVSAALLKFLIDREGDPEEGGYALWFITAIAAAGITVKLNFLALGVTASMLAWVIWFKRARGQDRANPRYIVVWVIIWGALVLLPWMIRGVITSGYIAFPLTFGSFKVEWRMPYEQVLQLDRWIRSWTRAPGMDPSEVLGNWQWLGPWFLSLVKTEESLVNLVTPVILTMVFGALALYYRCAQRGKWAGQGLAWVFLLCPVASILWWFFTAPDIRLAGAGFWILAAGCVALSIGSVEDLPNPIMSPLFAPCLALALCLIFLDKPLLPGRKRSGDFHEISKVELKTFVTRSGLMVYTPKDGGQSWDAPLPCTPYPQADLRLRKAGDLGSGFMLDQKAGAEPAK